MAVPVTVDGGQLPGRHLQPAPEVKTFDVVELVHTLLRAGEPEIYRKACLAVDRVILDAVLRQVKGSQVQASELLGIARTTLRATLRSLGMAVEKQLLTEADLED
jgi:two-component system nitrogen regulation response regulator GlnG